MPIGESRESQPNIEFDPEKHVKLSEKEGGGFTTKEAHEIRKLAEIAAGFNIRTDKTERTETMDVLREQASIEDSEHHLTPEQEKANLIEKIRTGRLSYAMLNDGQKRDLDIIAAHLERDPKNIVQIPADLQQKITNLLKGIEMNKEGYR
jgi:hypothetical protein